MTRKMALEEESMEALRREYLRLCEKFHRLKELARIDLDLLSVCLDLEQCPEAKVEFDKVNELVQVLMKEEIYELIHLLKEEPDEEGGQAGETGGVTSVEEAQDVEAMVETKMVKDCSVMVMKVDNFKMEYDAEDNTSDTAMDTRGTQTPYQTLPSVNKTRPESLPPRKQLTVNQAITNECKTLDNKTLFHKHKQLHAKEDNTCNVCGKQFARKSVLNRHTLIHSQETKFPLFICKLCGKNFRKEGTMKKHMNFHKADARTFDCEVCGKKFFHVGDLKKHMTLATHRNEAYSCTICGKKFSSKTYLKFHTSLHSSEKPFLCNICGKGFHQRLYLKEHMKRHDTNRAKLYCEVCGKGFSSRTNLSRHRRELHSDKKFKCEFCDKEFKSSSAMYEHKMQQHTDLLPHQCQKCGNLYKTPMRLGIHERIHIGESAFFPCSLCHATFTSKVEFRVHKAAHRNSKIYSCSKCQLQYVGLLAMAQHLITHPDVTFCIFCQQEFQSPAEFQSHVTTNHLAVNCTVCSEKFTSYRSLKKHQATHNTQGDFKCPDCGKSYTSKDKLVRHRLCMHLKTKKYTCEHCGRDFNFGSNFHRHLNIHRGLKPYKCPICEKEFSQKGQLENHSWTHRSDRRYRCETCGRGFNEKRAYMSHRKTQHQDIDGSSVDMLMNPQQTGADPPVEMSSVNMLMDPQQTGADPPVEMMKDDQQAQAFSADMINP